MEHRTQTDTATAKLIVVWAIVGIPLLWGFTQTLLNALKLFQ